jgi:hypothetical protein
MRYSPEKLPVDKGSPTRIAVACGKLFIRVDFLAVLLRKKIPKWEFRAAICAEIICERKIAARTNLLRNSP